MFDAEKIRNMTNLLETMPEYFDDVYLIPEIFTKEAAALLKRAKIPVRGIIHDFQLDKETWGIPVLRTAQASKNFSERTALINLVIKPAPFIQKTFDFKVGGGKWTLPALVIADEEVTLIYERVMIKNFQRLYEEDGISEPTKSLENLTERFSRGVTTFLDSRSQSFKYLPWNADNYFKPTHAFDDATIVIQGPIVYENNYTAETIKFYRSIYPRVPIILSTWRGEATDSFRRVCEKNSVVILENELPEERALGNVNLQLKSSLEGVKFVRENTSAKFVLKTRTDQRINYSGFLAYFKNLLKIFPPKDDRLRERIILLGSQTTIYPFNFHDFLAFGHVEDIFKLYSIPFHGKTGKLDYLRKNKPRVGKIGGLINSSKCCVDYNTVTAQSRKLFNLNKAYNRIWWPETYIMRTFYEKNIAPVDETKLFETHWKFTADYLILVDFGTLQLDWPKYEWQRYKIKFNYHGQDAFVRWLDMYRNFKIDWV